MVYSPVMTAPSKPVPQKDDDRAERLAAALRENLKRRKAQARSQALAKGDGRKPLDADKTGG
jgi:hypothetical protein